MTPMMFSSSKILPQKDFLIKEEDGGYGCFWMQDDFEAEKRELRMKIYLLLECR